MGVGPQVQFGVIDTDLMNIALAWRKVAAQSSNLQKQFGTLAALEAAGYDATDAQTALNFINFMNNLASVYYGTGTQATASNFDVAFAPLWAGQV